MSLTEQINADIKKAMLAKEKEKLAALRDIKAKLIMEATAGKGDVDEALENKVILKLHKQRMESYQLYVEQNRQDLADDELFEAKVIEAYLPKMMSEEEVRAEVVKAIAELGASGPQDMGKVMGSLTKALSGKADGKILSVLVKEELNK
ncbi:MAG TPA: GatB/YqeY domain-containing protein [Brumimicrobium sp.]|nr:GatB/YqeY domain-containing protein [Brumimicrobium sp.]